MQGLKKIFLVILFFFFAFGNPAIANDLTDAIYRDDLNNVEMLIKKGFDIDKKNKEGFTPLIIAAGLGNEKIVKVLLDAGADVNLLEDKMGTSALHKASQSGNVEIAKLLLSHGAFINLQAPTNGHTPLIDAIWHEKPELVTYLLEQMANPDIIASDGFTALNIVGRTNNSKLFESILIEHNKQKENYAKSLKLFNAVKQKDLGLTKKLISQGMDLNQRAENGMNPLLQAALQGNADIVKALLEAGADIKIVDFAMKSTPGHKAGYMGHPDVMKLLIKYGLDINAQGPYNGYTALHDAIWHHHSETVKVLVDSGTNLNLKTNNGKTPLELAKEFEFNDVVKIIGDKKVN